MQEQATARTARGERAGQSCVAVVLFMTWWSAWNLMDWMLDPRAPNAHMLVLLASALCLGVYVWLTKDHARHDTRELVVSP